jgi:hypothetical protein
MFAERPIFDLGFQIECGGNNYELSVTYILPVDLSIENAYKPNVLVRIGNI